MGFFGNKKEKIAVLYEKRDSTGKRIGKVVNLGTASSDAQADKMYSYYKRTGKKLKKSKSKSKKSKSWF